jgi:hypothetical protein
MFTLSFVLLWVSYQYAIKKHGGGRRGFWKWARSITKSYPTQSNHAEQLVRDSTQGVLHTEPSEINASQARHYRELLRNPHLAACRATIHHEAWERRRGGRSLSPALDGINGPIDKMKQCKTLKRLNNNNKVSRVDGITAETLKLAIYAPDSPFGKSLLELINKIWTAKCTP